MHDVARFREGAFNPEAMDTLTKAFATALDLLGPGEATNEEKAQLAKYLMEIARSGEINELRLADAAVLRLRGHDPASRAG